MSNGQITRQIKGEIYDSLRSALIAPQGKSKKSWTDIFIQKMLEEAKQNPAGPLGQLISKQLLQDDILSNLDAQTERLLARDQDFLRYRIYKQCYKEQRDVLLDETSKWILVNTGRRTGKTNLAARWLVKKCATPNSPCFYIHLKFDSAISQLFDLCIKSANQAELGIASSSKNEGRIVFTNGSSITFRGNSNKTEADKLRGFKARGVVIDEAAFQINEKYLIEDVLTPMMADFSDSQMIMISTPPRVPHTYYESCYRSGIWTIYEWNARKNPFIPSFNDFIKQVCKTKGIESTNTFILRELEGQFVYDTEAMVFKDYKTYKEIPDTFYPTDIAIGVDYGGTDYNAIIPLVYNRQTKAGYVLTERKFNKATASEIVSVCREIYNIALDFALKRNPNFEINKCCFYADSSNLPLTYELSNTYKLPIYNCYKHDKMFAIQQLADWCRTGIIQIPEKQTLEDEFERTVYKRDEQDNILPEIDDDLFHPDALDALLYASRQYAYDCGEDIGGESSDKKEKEGSRAQTLPNWINGLGEEYDD